MREHLAYLIGQAEPVEGRNIVREYLQARLLEALQRAGAMAPLAFHGGTALRFLFGIRRYSEDLDFCLERQPALYDLRAYAGAIRSALSAEGYDLDIRLDERRVVHQVMVRFPGLLYALGLSPLANQLLSIKIEIDTRPPKGAGLETTLVRRHVLLHLQHHDRASLLAGKVHAFLQRPFAKGRDVYDLLWYLGDRTWPPPNLTLLNNALRQTGWSGGELDEVTWREALRQRITSLAWERVVQDVRPFLEGEDLHLLTRENLLRVLD